MLNILALAGKMAQYPLLQRRIHPAAVMSALSAASVSIAPLASRPTTACRWRSPLAACRGGSWTASRSLRGCCSPMQQQRDQEQRLRQDALAPGAEDGRDREVARERLQRTAAPLCVGATARRGGHQGAVGVPRPP